MQVIYSPVCASRLANEQVKGADVPAAPHRVLPPPQHTHIVCAHIASPKGKLHGQLQPGGYTEPRARAVVIIQFERQ